MKDRVRERLEPFGLGWPNVVSAGRMLLVPVVCLLIAQADGGGSWAAFAVFAVAALSDGVDGYLARRHRMKTDTGAWLDPLSDKLLVTAPAIALSLLDRFPWWATIVLVGREVLVTFLRWRLDRRGVTMPASRTAKLKTLSQLVALGLAMAPLPVAWEPATLGATIVAVALTVYSGAEYLLTTRHQVSAE
jgi:CDP-diacylglycerol--glycerol-3-phosphate 3-phosphatidyltransferase